MIAGGKLAENTDCCCEDLSCDDCTDGTGPQGYCVTMVQVDPVGPADFTFDGWLTWVSDCCYKGELMQTDTGECDALVFAILRLSFRSGVWKIIHLEPGCEHIGNEAEPGTFTCNSGGTLIRTEFATSFVQTFTLTPGNITEWADCCVP